MIKDGAATSGRPLTARASVCNKDLLCEPVLSVAQHLAQSSSTVFVLLLRPAAAAAAAAAVYRYTTVVTGSPPAARRFARVSPTHLSAKPPSAPSSITRLVPAQHRRTSCCQTFIPYPVIVTYNLRSTSSDPVADGRHPTCGPVDDTVVLANRQQRNDPPTLTILIWTRRAFKKRFLPKLAVVRTMASQRPHAIRGRQGCPPRRQP
jgi:hypothetical protein